MAGTPDSSNRPRFKSLTLGVTLLIVSIAAAVMTVFSTVFIVSQRQRTIDTVTANSQAFASLSASVIDDTYTQYYDSTESGVFAKLQETMRGTLAKNTDTKRVQLVSATGVLLFDSTEVSKGRYDGNPRIVDDRAVLAQLKSKDVTTTEATVDGKKYLQIMVPVKSNGEARYVRYLVDRDGAVGTRLTQAYQRLAILCSILLVLVITFSMLIASRLSRPVKLLTTVTQKIATGDLTQRVPIGFDNEYGQLATSFNAMADKLQQVYDGLERKVSEKTAQLAQKVQEVEAEKDNGATNTTRRHTPPVAAGSQA